MKCNGCGKKPPRFRLAIVPTLVKKGRLCWGLSVAYALLFSVTTLASKGMHSAFVIEAFSKNNKSVITAQGPFHIHLALGQNAAVLDQKTVLLWVENSRAPGLAYKP